jgi:hypothetical protein
MARMDTCARCGGGIWPETPAHPYCQYCAEIINSVADVEPHTLTVAELKDLATEEEIDLEGATRKDDIRNKVIDGLSVAGLRDFAKREGISLHGAQTKADIIEALRTPASDEEDAEPEEKSGFRFSF